MTWCEPCDWTDAILKHRVLAKVPASSVKRAKSPELSAPSKRGVSVEWYGMNKLASGPIKKGEMKDYGPYASTA